MQSPYTEQAHRQYRPSTPSHNSDSRYPHPGVTDFTTSVFSQRVAPSYNAQSYTSTRDTYRDQPAVRTGPGYGNDAYGGDSIPGYGSNHAMAGSQGTPVPQPLQNSDYSMPSIPNSNLRQGEPYYAGYHFGTQQVPGPTMSFSSHFPQVNPGQDAPSEWRGSESNHAMAGSRGTPAPQPLQNGAMPLIPYSNFRQGEPYYAGSHFGVGQVPNPTMSFPPRLPEAGPNQDASPEWRFHTCWVSHAEEDEIHLSIALKKS